MNGRAQVILTDGTINSFSSNEEAYLNIFYEHYGESVKVIEEDGNVNEIDKVDRRSVVGRAPELSYPELYDEIPEEPVNDDVNDDYVNDDYDDYDPAD